jgi:hypothetical protein
MGMLERAFAKKSWHGTTLRGALRSVTAEEAIWRPAPGRHNIWELAVHAAYWKYAVRRRLTNERRGTFPLKGSNWFPRPATTDAAGKWSADLQLLDRMHGTLLEAVASLHDDVLQRRVPGSSFTYNELISGSAAHDLYHAGQIQLLRRLRPA